MRTLVGLAFTGILLIAVHAAYTHHISKKIAAVLPSSEDICTEGVPIPMPMKPRYCVNGCIDI